ncbi:uncharacterized protein A4U43_C03F19120 [Asparagus officinalis]|uniref:Uncharacterized protein n=1 Tax=Asparagus officinalis TaxID=4686 RepID=A0A5P1FG95_ASPOF|nr:uncharacterized protein A4U43_C03F19120 [Asparagus officinalis]
MEMVMPRAPTSPDFHFTRSTSPSPYATAPSSPKPFGNTDEYFYCYTSAPTSPTRASAVRSYFTGDSEDWEAGTTASEGRATGRGSKDPLNKYTLLSASFSKGGGGQDKKSSTSSKSMERKGSSVSAHELHYTANRAASEEEKKKTPLPYHRNTLFGCLHFNPAVKSITRGFNAYSFNQGRS